MRKIQKTIPFKIASERIRNRSGQPEVKDLYPENYKKLVKDIDYITNKWGDR